MAGEALTGAQLARANWQALGTGVALRLTDCAALAHARACVELELAAIDRACSRFREDSDLSRVNARAGRPVAVSALLMDALDVAVRAAELTGGDVDPTVGLALELAGYDRDWRRLASAELMAAPDPRRARPASRPAWSPSRRRRPGARADPAPEATLRRAHRARTRLSRRCSRRCSRRRRR